MINTSLLTQVYGKSGLGKTSLIRAGIFPQLKEKEILPVYLRVEDYQQSLAVYIGRVFDCISTSEYRIFVHYDGGLHIINRHELNEDRNQLLVYFGNNQTWQPGSFWELFHRIVILDTDSEQSILSSEDFSQEHRIRPALVIDQFEEIFTIGKGSQLVKELAQNLKDLASNYIPEHFRLQASEPGFRIPFPHRVPHYKLVLSFREDYLADVSKLFQNISLLPTASFRLEAFNHLQAKEAILGAGAIDSKELAEDIIHFFLPKGMESTIGEVVVEPAILSLICDQIYVDGADSNDLEHRLSEVLGNSRSDGIPSKDDIILKFYHETISQYPPEVREFFENNLITESGYRVPVYIDQLDKMQLYQGQLIDDRLLRKTYYDQKEHIELIHDVIARSVQVSRDRNRENVSFRQKRQRKMYMNVIGGMIGILCILIAFFVKLNNNYRALQASQDRILSDQIQIAKKDSIAKYTYEAQIARETDPTKALKLMYKALSFEGEENDDVSLSPSKKNAHEIYARNIIYTEVYKPLKGSFSMSYMTERNSVLFADESAVLEVNTKDFEISEFAIHPVNQQVTSIAISEQGNLVALGSKDFLSLWTKEGEFIDSFEVSLGNNPYGRSFETFTTIAISPDGTNIAAGSHNDILIYDSQTFNARTLSGHEQNVLALAYSPDGKYLVSAGIDAQIILWNSNYQAQRKIKAHDHPITDLKYSEDGSQIISGALDFKAKLWDSKTLRLLNTFEDQNHNVHAVGFSSQNDTSLKTQAILVGYDNGNVTVFDSDGTKIARLRSDQGELTEIVMVPNLHTTFTSSEDGSIKKWDFDFAIPKTISTHSEFLRDVSFGEGDSLLSCSRDGVAIISKIEPFERLRSWTNKGLSYNSGVLLEGLNVYLAEMGNLQKIIHDTVSTVDLGTHDGEPFAFETIFDLRVSKDEKRLLVSGALNSEEGKIIELSLENDNIITEIDCQNWIYQSDYNPTNNDFFAACSKDSSVTIFERGKAVNKIKLQTKIRALAYTPSGQNIILAGNNGMVYNMELGKDSIIVHEFQYGHAETVTDIDISSDGKTIVTSSNDNSVIQWNSKGLLENVFIGHTDKIMTISLSRDNKHIATGSYDNKIKIWRVRKSLILL